MCAPSGLTAIEPAKSRPSPPSLCTSTKVRKAELAGTAKSSISTSRSQAILTSFVKGERTIVSFLSKYFLIPFRQNLTHVKPEVLDKVLCHITRKLEAKRTLPQDTNEDQKGASSERKKQPKTTSLPTQESLRQPMNTFVVFCRFGVISGNTKFSVPQIMTFVNTTLPLAA